MPSIYTYIIFPFSSVSPRRNIDGEELISRFVEQLESIPRWFGAVGCVKLM